MKNTRWMVFAAAIIGVLLAARSAVAAPVFISGGTVTFLEATYMPGSFYFRLTSGDATCPNGTSLLYSNTNAENTKAVYATLLAAYMSGKPVYAVYESGTVKSSTCATVSCCLITYIGVQ